jgi:hypothetical protein
MKWGELGGETPSSDIKEEGEVFDDETNGDPGAIRGRRSRKRLASFARPRTRDPQLRS